MVNPDCGSDIFLEGAMGHSQAEKAKTHKRIVQIASKRFREDGLAGVGVADVMKDAGLTVGGFYKHFDSRDDLVAEALSAALGRLKRQMDASASGGPPLTYSKVVDDYLSEGHRDKAGAGCPISALAGEIARSDRRIRSLATEGIRSDIQVLAGLIAGLIRGKDKTARAKAILTFSALVGAIELARAVSDEELSSEILKTVNGLLKDMVADR
jgi:TetR/AcrR family transcriptional repressor of nem operon